MGKALDALGGHWSEEGGEEGGVQGLSREVKEVVSTLNY